MGVLNDPLHTQKKTTWQCHCIAMLTARQLYGSKLGMLTHDKKEGPCR